jgi:probable addiction module antidote protein
MKVETVPFVAEKYFQSDESQRGLIQDALDSGDTAWLVHAIGIVARARGIGEIAQETGLSRQALYAAFGPKGNPTIATVMKVLGSLGLTLVLKDPEPVRKAA